MKRFRSLLSFLISLLIILSAVVFPAAEQSRVLKEPPAAPVAASFDDLSGAATARVVSAPSSGTMGQPSSYIPTSNGTDLDASFAVPISEPETVSVPDPPMPSAIPDDAGQSAVSGAASEQSAADIPPSETSPAAPDEPAPAAAPAPIDTADAPVGEPEPSSAQPVRSFRNELILPTIDTMYPLEFGKDYTGMLTSVDERYVYHFTVSERGFLQYSVKHDEMRNFMGWDVTLYQEYYLNGVSGEIGYRPLNLLQTTALATTETSPTVGVMPGKYRVVVRTTGGIQAETYTLNVSFTADHTHEIECNDTKAAYTELYANLPMVGSASCYTDRQDDDWYLLRVQKNGKVRLTFTHEASDNVSVAWRVALYNESGEELYAENSGMNKDKIDSGEIGVTAGIYFVAVLGRVRCDHDYTLTATAAADEQFERENNDTMETANPLSNGGTVKGCVSAKAGRLDRDFFRFEMPARGNFSMTFTHDAAAEEGKKADDKNGWNVRLLSSSGELLYAMVSTWNIASVSMPVMGLEDGVYYIEVNSEDLYRNTMTYTLKAGNTQSSSFETEPNNTPAQATPIANGVPVTGTIIDSVDPDDDYFVFSVPAYSRLTVYLKHEAVDKEKDIFRFSVWDDNGEKMPLYSGGKPVTGADGNNVYYVDSTGKQPSVYGSYELAAGTYYIKVTSGRFFPDIDYMVQFYFN